MEKSNNTLLYIVAVLVAIGVGVGVFFALSGGDKAEMPDPNIAKNDPAWQNTENLDNNTDTDEVDDSDTSNSTDDTDSEPETLGFEERYLSYNSTTLARAHEQSDVVVVFFHASWCPTCRALESEIVSNFEELNPNVTILKTDYDTSDDLKKKYGVPYQHTLVQVDENGNEITQWTGGGISTINSNIEL